MNIARYLLVLSALIIPLSAGMVAAQSLTCGGAIADAADSTPADGATWYAYKPDSMNILQGGTVGEVISGYWAGEVGYFLQPLTVSDEVLVLIEKERNSGSIDHAGYYAVIDSQLGNADPVAFPAMTLRPVPVPVATIEGSAVSVSWQEAGEDGFGNVIGYDLFRSSDGLSFEKVNTDTIATLSYTDSTFTKDTNYYVIRLVYRGNPPVESHVYSANSNALQTIDSDGDALSDILELSGCTSPSDTDSDDDGIPDNVEDANRNGIVDVGEDINHNGILDVGEDTNGDNFLNPGETDPCLVDTDEDGIQDGTESGLTVDDIGQDTDTSVFIADADPSTTTNPTLADSDQDGITDGEEDTNHNGRVDSGESDPNRKRGTVTPFLMLLLEEQ